MTANSATTKSDTPLWVFDKFRDLWWNQCRQCSYPLELDEASNCYRHLVHRPGQLHCDAEQPGPPTTARTINNTNSLRKRDRKKDNKMS